MSSQHSSSVWGRAAGWATVMMDPHVMSSQGEQQSAVIGIPERCLYIVCQYHSSHKMIYIDVQETNGCGSSEVLQYPLILLGLSLHF